MRDLNTLANEVYAQNKIVGWWDDPDRCIYQTIQLISTEIAEATEGERKNLMDDHLPHRKMGEVELADALIRTLDLGGHLEISYRLILPHPWIREASSIGKQHLGINCAICSFAQLLGAPQCAQESSYSQVISSILECGEINGYDVMAAVKDKLAYNKTRADHTRENRAKPDGKKF